jgi:hypothetical protein
MLRELSVDAAPLDRGRDLVSRRLILQIGRPVVVRLVIRGPASIQRCQARSQFLQQVTLAQLLCFRNDRPDVDIGWLISIICESPQILDIFVKLVESQAAEHRLLTPLLEALGHECHLTGVPYMLDVE